MIDLDLVIGVGWFLVIFLAIALLGVFFALAIKHYHAKIMSAGAKHPRVMAKYRGDLSVGIVSGVMVAVLDRTVNSIKIPAWDSGNVLSSIISAATWLEITFVGILFVLLAILWLMYRGIPSQIETRQKN